ncbi:density-regulated protein-like [Rhopilema esculentum]|uniref:density-regulated protein-like n=1 Tax=Rhopilema esculentum TaxID=499914 RepID=UPI0031E3980A|eukprot:gene15326-6542_t
MADGEAASQASENVSYPLNVLYCGVCGLPPEFCEYGPDFDKCKAWLEQHDPSLLTSIANMNLDSAEGDDKDNKKRQTRGGKANRQAKKKTAVQKITITKEQRSKKKTVTVVNGLSTFEIDLKKASKLFANKFSCGSSVTGDDEIVIQGDVSYDLIELIQSHWPEVDDDSIEDRT